MNIQNGFGISNMNLKEHIRKVLREEINPLSSALRRVNFSNERIEHFLKVFSLRFHKNEKDIESLINKVCNFASYELIEPGLLHMSDEDADKAVKELSNKLKNEYSPFIETYVAELIESDDDETYCFRKHSDKHMDMKTNRGFGECVQGWNNFMYNYGSWFPDLDWNQIKEKISSEPNKYLLIKNPLENHPYEYYFSVLKKNKR